MNDISTTNEQVDTLNEIEHNVSLKTDAEIELLIKETEETLQSLMTELKKRQEDVQHKDIDDLENHLEHADISFKAIKNFIAMALKEIRG